MLNERSVTVVGVVRVEILVTVETRVDAGRVVVMLTRLVDPGWVAVVVWKWCQPSTFTHCTMIIGLPK